MRRREITPIEQWAMRSKPHAFGFLLGLALLISAGMTGAVSLLVSVAAYGLLPNAVASTR
jgi:hypothetical protein